MLFSFFAICAVVGGTIFLFQLAMTLLGMDSDGDLDIDMPDDVDFDADGSVVDHGSTWLFSIISLRTLVAAALFFGLGGIAALQAGQSDLIALGVAAAAGLGAMYAVHWLMRAMYGLAQDRTVRLEEAIGERGSVYVPIPANQSGVGKVQIRMQERIVELAAVTDAGEKLATGTRVEVVQLIGPQTVEVRPVLEPHPTAE
jgi:hypothetical protein